MAPKRPLENPPPASSSDEEEELVSDAEEDGDSGGVEDDGVHGGEGEDSEPPLKKSVMDSGEYADSDREGTPMSPSISGFTIKRISEQSAVGSAAKHKKAATNLGSKHAADTDSNPDESIKKKKKKGSSSASAFSPAVAAVRVTVADGDEEEGKKVSGATPRLWSEADEIAILKGMSEFKVKTRSDSSTDSNAFYDFIKQSLHVEVSKSQLMEKIRRLKKKFRNNAAKGGNGGDPVFAKFHDSKTYELSKKIWGQDDGLNNGFGGKKKTKQSKSNTHKNNNSEQNVEECSQKPLTLALPKLVASTKKQGGGKASKSELNSGSEGANGSPRTNLESEIEGNGEEGSGRERMDVDSGHVFAYKENGDVNGITEPNKSDGAVAEEEKVCDVEEFWSKYSYMKEFLKIGNSLELLSSGKRFFYENSRLIGSEKASEMNEKWKRLKLEEIELQVKKFDLVREQMKLVYDTVKESA